MIEARINQEQLLEDVKAVTAALDHYKISLQSYYRQVSLRSNELLRGTVTAKLEIALNNVKHKHMEMIARHTTVDVFNILSDEHPLNSVRVLNFSALPVSKKRILEKEPSLFEKFDFPNSSEKEAMEDFETHAGFLVKLDDFEPVNIGHIYCTEKISRHTTILSGRFGTAVSNRAEKTVTRVAHSDSKIFNCRHWKSFQMYFPQDSQVFVWQADGVVLTVNHTFKSGDIGGIRNYSKCVHSRQNKVYFLAIPSSIIEIDWFEVELAVSRGVESLSGRVIHSGQYIEDFCFLDQKIYFIKQSGIITLGYIDPCQEEALAVEQHLEMITDMDMTAIAAKEKIILIAGHNSRARANEIYVIDSDLKYIDRILVPKAQTGYAPIRSITPIDRQDSTYFIGLCTLDQVLLFQLSGQQLKLLETMTLSSGMERTILNGIQLDELKARILVFGDFNFQLTLKLRV